MFCLIIRRFGFIQVFLWESVFQLNCIKVSIRLNLMKVFVHLLLASGQVWSLVGPFDLVFVNQLGGSI